MWLYGSVFPVVRAFFRAHQGHRITYVESGSFFGLEDFDDWLEIEGK